MSKILCPVDFSEVSVNALKYAAEFAKLTHSEVHALFVQQINIVNMEGENDIFPMNVNELLKASEEKLNNLIIEHKLEDIVTITESRLGFITDEIAETADDEEYSLIIMGSTGASGLKEILFGSTTLSVIEKSKTPVLVIPKNSTFQKPSKILFCTDYRSGDMPVLSQLNVFSSLFDAQLHILHVSQNVGAISDDVFKVYKEKAKEALGKTKVHFHKVISEDEAYSIEEFINQNDIDIVSILQYKKSFFERIFKKSVTRELAFHTEKPLLVFSE